jgi:outer membrane protein TolC
VNAFALLVVIGATPITLSEVRELSRRNVPALLSELTRRQASEQVRVSTSAILPLVNLRSDVSRTEAGPRRTIQTRFTGALDPNGVPISEQVVSTTSRQVSHNYDLIASLQQLLFDGGKWWNQIAQSGAQERAADGQFREQQLTSEYEGARRFYLLLGAQRALGVLNDTVKRSQDQLDRANALYEAGRGTKSDAIQAQVNLGNDRIAAVRQEATIAGAQADLAVWIAHPGAEELVAEDPGTISGTPAPPPNFDDATKAGLEYRPLLKALSEQVQAADYGIAVARAGFYPRVSANIQYSRIGNTVDPVFTDPSLNNTFTVGLVLSWDLFSGFLTVAQTAQAQYSKTSADLNLADARRGMEGDVRRNLRTVQVQIDAAKIAEDNRHAAQDGLVLAQERFNAGLANTLEVRDAQLKLTQAELSLLQVRIDLEVAREGLRRVTGGFLEGAPK